MTSDFLNKCLDALGWSPRLLGEYLQVGERLGRNWAAGKREVPDNVDKWLTKASAFLREHPYPDGWRVNQPDNEPVSPPPR